MNSTATLNIAEYVAQIASACPEVEEIWLIGSRANGTERPGSDWDLVVFGRAGSLNCLKKRRELHRSDVDCLVMTDSDQFVSAWGPDRKSGSLSGWEWARVAAGQVEYTETKGRGTGDSFNVVLNRKNGVRVWPLEDHAT